MSRKTVVVAVLLLGVGALAAAAAHVSMSAPVRSDIELLVPAPPRVADKVQPDASRAGAPLFATNSAARTRREALDDVETGVAGAVPTAQSLAANAEARRAAAAGRYRDYTSSRDPRRRSSGGSGGSAAFGGGGFGGGGMGGGVSGTAPRRGNSANTPAATRATRASGSGSQRNGSSGNQNPNVVAANGAAPVLPPNVAPAAQLGPIAVGAGSPGNGPSPAAAPEPLTLLLVGSGLAGLYGARKHLAG
jgi:hypothetical protein